MADRTKEVERIFVKVDAEHPTGVVVTHNCPFYGRHAVQGGHLSVLLVEQQGKPMRPDHRIVLALPVGDAGRARRVVGVCAAKGAVMTAAELHDKLLEQAKPIVGRLAEQAHRMRQYPHIDEPLIISDREVNTLAAALVVCDEGGDRTLQACEASLRAGTFILFGRKVLVV
jgi:hypothetical protein